MCKCVQNLIENVPTTPYGWLVNDNTLCCICLRSCCFGMEKTQKMHFFPVLDLTSLQPDSLTTIKVKPHQCPLHQFTLLTQGPIPEIFVKKYWELAVLKNSVFFVSAILFFCFIPMKSVKVSWVAKMGRNFDDYPGFKTKTTAV